MKQPACDPWQLCSIRIVSFRPLAKGSFPTVVTTTTTAAKSPYLGITSMLQSRQWLLTSRSPFSILFQPHRIAFQVGSCHRYIAILHISIALLCFRFIFFIFFFFSRNRFRLVHWLSSLFPLFDLSLILFYHLLIQSRLFTNIAQPRTCSVLLCPAMFCCACPANPL